MTAPGLLRKLMFVPPLLAGAGVVWFAVATREPPARLEATEPVRKVRVVAAPRAALTPRVVGHGTVRSADVWNAVAEVAGRIVEVHPELENGAIVPAGALLVRIDPRSYELALKQLEAERAELDQQLVNNRSALEIETRNLALAEQELERQKALGARGTAALTAVDQAERNTLAARQSVRSLENALALLPAQRDLLAARIEQARLNLDHTRIEAPFALRINRLEVENQQYVGVGRTLFQGESISRAEVTVKVTPEQMRRLTRGVSRERPLTLTEMTTSFRDVLKIAGRVTLPDFDNAGAWDARFERTELIDASTRTLGVVVSVADPYAGAVPGKRPPLVGGMFVRVELTGLPIAPLVYVPRTALHGGRVRIADADGRLREQPVEVEFFQDGLAVLRGGLDAGTTVVVSDLVPAIPGTLLDSEVDASLSAELAAAGAAAR